MPPAQGQQVGRAVEGIGQVVDRHIGERAVPLLILGQHETAADGEIGGGVKFPAGRVESLEAKPVGVAVEKHIASEQQVAGRVEGDLRPAAQRQTPAVGDRADPGRHAVRIKGFRPRAHQTQQHRRVGAMAAPGEGQGAEQADHHPCDAIQAPAIGQSREKPTGGDHRSGGMRTGGADPDLEQIESADHLPVGLGRAGHAEPLAVAMARPPRC